MLQSIWSCENEKPKRFQLLNSEQTGIDFINSLKPSREFNILEYLYYYNGGGVSAGDINNDGLVDLYFTANQNENKELAVVFSSLYDSLKQNAQQIDDELISAQGQPQDVGGYYMPNDELASKAMRPSTTLNGIIDALA